MNDEKRLFITNIFFDFLEKNIDTILKEAPPEEVIKFTSFSYVLEFGKIDGDLVKNILIKKTNISEEEFHIVLNYLKEEELKENVTLFDEVTDDEKKKMIQYQKEMIDNLSLKFSDKAINIFNAIVGSNDYNKLITVIVDHSEPIIFYIQKFQNDFFIGSRSGDAYLFANSIDKLITFNGKLSVEDIMEDKSQMYVLNFDNKNIVAVAPHKIKEAFLFDYNGNPLPEDENKEFIYPHFKDIL
jgi:hypothetical protein